LTIVAVALLLAACGTTPVTGGGTTVDSAAKATPVVFVHGYSGASCPGNDVTHNIWGGAYLELSNADWTGPLLPVSYYACDTDGVDVTGYGAHAPAGATATITDARPRVHYDQNTSIDQLAHDLGWFVYDSYSAQSTPVDLVGVSMGGLVIRDLLYRVAQHDPRFPPRLFVPRAVTLSTPHLGYGTTASNIAFCGGHFVECDQFATDSRFIAELTAHARDPQAAGGTQWTVAGSSAGCDFMPAQSALGLPAAQRVDYLSPCYGHAGYLWDLADTDDAATRVVDPGSAPVISHDAPRSLAWLVATLAAPAS
jgi:hypothetical protein